MRGWERFQTRVPGKWVLAGEHAVLRGVTAIALPHPEFGLKLSFQPAEGGELQVEPSDARAVIFDLLESIRDDYESRDLSFPRPSGVLRLESTIPMGAGLGSSAALCVAMTRWLSEPLSIAKTDAMDFATRLEHRFHGRSSGMDVAAIFSGEPIAFVSGRGARSLGTRVLPRFSFHDTGLRARTSDCVHRVERMREDQPHLSMKIDEKMSLASRLAMEGLMAYDRGDKPGGLETLARSMRHSSECFLDWQLVPGEALRLIESLMKQGAIAARITGAGGGGMVVALWPDGN